MEPSHLSPHFVIPKGTQVVLKKDIHVLGAPSAEQAPEPFKKSGSVGEVLEAPLTNEYAYLVRFADGLRVAAHRQDLAVRRSDAPEDDLPAREIAAYAPHVFYKVRVGSKAFGLADEHSDDDERGIYLPPAEWHWSMQPLPEQVEFKITTDGRVLDHNEKERGSDVCWWELEKLLRLALRANPNALEALFVPESCVLHCDPLGWQLRDLAPVFLSKYLYQTYSGYVLSQFRKMKREIEKGNEHRPKHAMHLIRLLYSGIAALKGSGILVDVGRHREELLSIKHEKIPFQAIYDEALALDKQFQKAFEACTLPEKPDMAAVDRFLIDARRSKT